MGGGRAPYVNSSSEEESLLDQEFPGLSLGLAPTLPRSDRSSEKVDNITSDGENGGCDESYPQISPNSLDFEADQRRRRSVIREIPESYDEMRRPSRNLEEAKSKILRSDHLSEKVDGSTLDGENGDFDDLRRQSSSNSLDFEADQRRRHSVFMEVLESYNELRRRSENLEVAKSKILSYYPGAWMEEVGGIKMSDYDIPTMTSLLLIGPKGSGKSSLVNRISRVFEDDKFAPDRAQVSYNTSVGDGTYFLQEYMIPRGSTSLCLYDTRSLTGDSSTNMVMLTHWMTRGVRHGELVIRDTDCSMMKTRMKCKARQSGFSSSETRMVNYVIFVVNGVSILKSMYGDDEAAEYMEMVATTFSCPFLSFKDDKPVVVVTHGDLLSLSDRARVRVHLGEMLGISPTKQIFDISESCDLATELATVDMLRYSLEHADKNLPVKKRFLGKVFRKTLPACLFLLILGIAIIAAHICSTGTHHAPPPSAHMHHTPAPPPPPPPIVHKNPTPQTPPPRAHKHHAPPTAPPSADMNRAPPPPSANKRRIPSPSAHTHHAPPTAPPSANMHSAHKRRARSPSAHRHCAPPIDAGLDWRSTRHLWLGSEYD